MGKINIQMADAMQITDDAIYLFKQNKEYTFFSESVIRDNFTFFSQLVTKMHFTVVLGKSEFNQQELNDFLLKHGLSDANLRQYEQELFKRRTVNEAAEDIMSNYLKGGSLEAASIDSSPKAYMEAALLLLEETATWEENIRLTRFLENNHLSNYDFIRRQLAEKSARQKAGK